MPAAMGSESIERFQLSNYSASIDTPAGISRWEFPPEIRDSCPNHYRDRIRRLILQPLAALDGTGTDTTDVVRDVMRAGFLVLSCQFCRSVETRPGSAFLLYVCS